MKCRWAQDRILLYLAGELRAKESARLLRHLEGCARCNALADELAETQGAVYAALQADIDAPDSLLVRVMSAIRSQPSDRPSWYPFTTRRMRRRTVAAGAAVCLVAVFLLAGVRSGRIAGFRAGTSAAQPPVLDLAALGEIYRTEPAHRSETPEEVSRLAAKLSRYAGIPVAITDLRQEGAELVGCRGCAIQGVRVASIQYQWKGRRVAMFQMDAMKLSAPALRQVPHNGRCYLVGKTKDLTYVLWCSGRTNVALVARIPPNDLLQLAMHAGEMPTHSS